MIHQDEIQWPETMYAIRPESDHLEDTIIAFSRNLVSREQITAATQTFVQRRSYLEPQEIGRHQQLRQQMLEQKLMTSLPVTPWTWIREASERETAFLKEYSSPRESQFGSYLQARYRKEIAYQQGKLDRFAYDKTSQRSIGLELSTQQSLGGKRAEALQTVERVLALDGKDAKAMSLKGQMQVMEGQFSTGLQSLEQAQKLGAMDALTWAYIGLARLYQGQHVAALEAFQKRLEVSTDVDAQWFALIWMRIAADRVSVDFSPYETRYWAQLQSKRELPAALYEYLTGKIDEKALRRAAQSKDAFITWRNQCEVDFFMGIRELQRGQTEEARALFKKAANSPVIDFIETTMARHELAQMP